MATSFSKNELKYARKKFYGRFHSYDNSSIFQKIINFTLTRIYKARFTLLNLKRKILRAIKVTFLKKHYAHKDIQFKINLEKDKIQNISEKLKANNCVFVENFLSKENHEFLINSWPCINHFNHNKKITAHYNSSFSHIDATSSIEKVFDKYPKNFGLRKFYEFLYSYEFAEFFNRLLKFENRNFKLWAISSTMASNNSYLAPHKDGIANDKKIEHPYNFIYFLDGYEKNLSSCGATGIYKDNEFKFPILVPNTIKNSLLIYNQSDDFYHGFQTIKCPKDIFRKTINFQIK